jgi:hypothetical protein
LNEEAEGDGPQVNEKSLKEVALRSMKRLMEMALR